MSSATETFVQFTCDKLIWDNVKGRKVPVGMPKEGWKGKTVEEYAALVKPYHKVKCVLTGESNNITVFDFDSTELYDETVDTYPYLRDCYTVKTSRGYHIYTKYVKEYETTHNTEIHLDVLCDNAIIFGATTVTSFEPIRRNTEYILVDNEQRLDITMPEEIYRKAKPPKKKKIIKAKQKLKLIPNPPPPATNQHQHNIINLIDTKYIDNRSDFIQMAMGMKSAGFSHQQVKEFASKSKHFRENFDEWFESIWAMKPTAKWGTLCHYAKRSNEKQFFRLIAQEKKDDTLETTDIALAKQFIELVDADLLYQDNNLYIYDKNEGWYIDRAGHFFKRCFHEAMESFYMEMKNGVYRELESLAEGDDGREPAEKQVAAIDAALKKIGSNQTLNAVLQTTKALLATRTNDIIFDVNKEQEMNIHFRNGVYEYDTAIFRERTKYDYVTSSAVLSWDYDPEQGVEDEEEVELFFRKIVPNDDKRKMLLSYLSMCLTARTDKEKFIMLVGYSASNAKSTIFNVMKGVFEHYVKECDNRTFNLNYAEKRHKQIIALQHIPVRMIYMEELGSGKLDVNFTKQFVSGETVSVEVLYGTSADVNVRAKLITSSNRDPNLDIDSGIVRRMNILYLTSQFLDIEEDDWENNRFKKVEGVKNLFKSDAFRNALFRLLVKEEYKNYEVCESVAAATKEVVEALDDLRDRFDDRFEITKDDNDFVHKDIVVEALGYQDTKKCIADLKRFDGIKYRPQKKANQQRGFFCGMRLLPPPPLPPPPPL